LKLVFADSKTRAAAPVTGFGDSERVQHQWKLRRSERNKESRIMARCYEPACGDGNFLTVILERKLAVVEKRYGKSQLDFERYAVLAVSSIYGIDILPGS
jgi:hypothetical protein